MPRISLTPKFVTALAALTPVVHPRWVERASQRTDLTSPLPDVDDPALAPDPAAAGSSLCPTNCQRVHPERSTLCKDDRMLLLPPWPPPSPGGIDTAAVLRSMGATVETWPQELSGASASEAALTAFVGERVAKGWSFLLPPDQAPSNASESAEKAAVLRAKGAIYTPNLVIVAPLPARPNTTGHHRCVTRRCVTRRCRCVTCRPGPCCARVGCSTQTKQARCCSCPAPALLLPALIWHQTPNADLACRPPLPDSQVHACLVNAKRDVLQPWNSRAAAKSQPRAARAPAPACAGDASNAAAPTAMEAAEAEVATQAQPPPAGSPADNAAGQRKRKDRAPAPSGRDEPPPKSTKVAPTATAQPQQPHPPTDSTSDPKAFPHTNPADATPPTNAADAIPPTNAAAAPAGRPHAAPPRAAPARAAAASPLAPPPAGWRRKARCLLEASQPAAANAGGDADAERPAPYVAPETLVAAAPIVGGKAFRRRGVGRGPSTVVRMQMETLVTGRDGQEAPCEEEGPVQQAEEVQNRFEESMEMSKAASRAKTRRR